MNLNKNDLHLDLAWIKIENIAELTTDLLGNEPSKSLSEDLSSMNNGTETMKQQRLNCVPRSTAHTLGASVRILAAISMAIGALLPSVAFADSKQAIQDTITIYGSESAKNKVTGSAQYLDELELEKFEYADIQQILRQIPGVSLQIEDGYGLRPNISIRGVATERSGRITLLEDNVLIAPAPYSAPSAYYFPTPARMTGFEVVKGSASITQGPYTIGGALNMISTPIPSQASGQVTLEAGEDSTFRLHANYGAREDNGFGYVIEAHQWQSDGFQTIDRSSTDTGLDVSDYMVKLGYAPDDSAHSVELKLGYTDQKSNQSYLGLSDSDFRSNSIRRYGLSNLDNIKTEHTQAILRYAYEFSDTTSLSVVAYDNQHQRNWFKTEGIDLDGSNNAQDFSRTSWSSVIAAINSGAAIGDTSSSQLQSILNGTQDTPEGSIQLRSNNREYFSRGIQLGLNWNATVGDATHSVEVGVRLHEDQEDRLQRNSSYQQVGGELLLNDIGELGNAGNRVQEAQALAIHIYDQIEFGRWNITPGLRYEDIDQMRTNYSGGANRAFSDSRENSTDVLLPGVGALYKISDTLSTFAGVHKGFTAPSNSPGAREEEAINYELGLRYGNGKTQIEATYFLSDYDNLVGECTSSSGSGCEIGDAFNGDAATVQGVEFLLQTQLAEFNQVRVPLNLTLTLIDGEFDTDIADTEFFGNVVAGDTLPYIPEAQGQLGVGLESDKWSSYLNVIYLDEVCTRASCGQFERSDSSLTIDLSASYYLSEEMRLFTRIDNLSDEQDIMGRQPYGARPNKARTFSIGAQYRF